MKSTQGCSVLINMFMSSGCYGVAFFCRGARSKLGPRLAIKYVALCTPIFVVINLELQALKTMFVVSGSQLVSVRNSSKSPSDSPFGEIPHTCHTS